MLQNNNNNRPFHLSTLNWVLACFYSFHTFVKKAIVSHLNFLCNHIFTSSIWELELLRTNTKTTGVPQAISDNRKSVQMKLRLDLQSLSAGLNEKKKVKRSWWYFYEMVVFENNLAFLNLSNVGCSKLWKKMLPSSVFLQIHIKL